MFPSSDTHPAAARLRRALALAVAFATLDAIVLDAARPQPARGSADVHPHRRHAAAPPRARRPGRVAAPQQVCRTSSAAAGQPRARRDRAGAGHRVAGA